MFTIIIVSEKARVILDEYELLFAPFIREGILAFCDWRTDLAEGRSFDEVFPGLRQMIRGKESWRAVVVGDEGFEQESGSLRTPRENPFDFAWANRVLPPEVKGAEQAQVLVTHLLMGYPQVAPEFRPYFSYQIDTKSDLSNLLKKGVGCDCCAENIQVKSATFYPGYEHEQDRLRIVFKDDKREQIDERFEDFWARVKAEKEIVENYLLAKEKADADREKLKGLPLKQVFYYLINKQMKRCEEERFEEKEPRSPGDRQRIKELQDQYKPSEMIPDEIICIQTRRALGKQESEIKSLWETKIEEQRSNFVERNNYPPETRFVCFDMVSPNTSSYKRRRFEYCLCTLAIALAHIPASYFQAYYLYSVDVEVDAEELLREYSQLYGVITGAMESIGQRLNTPPTLVFRSDDLLTQTVIPVELERLNLASLKPPVTQAGIVRDRPSPGELASWQSSASTIRGQIDRFDRLPKRILSCSVSTMHDYCDVFPADEYELDSFDIDELEAAAGTLRFELAKRQNSKAFDRAEVGKKLDDADKRISGFIRTRMDGGRALAGFGIMVLAIVLTLAPLLIAAFARGGVYLMSGFLIILVVSIGATVGLLCALWSSRKRLRRMLAKLKSMLQMAESCTAERLSELGGFLGRIATLTNARTMLSEASDDGTRHRLRLRKLFSAQSKLRKERDRIVDLLHSHGKDVTSVSVRPSPIDVDNIDALFNSEILELQSTRKKMRLNDSGERIYAPYGFMEGLNIMRSPVFEPDLKKIGDSLAQAELLEAEQREVQNTETTQLSDSDEDTSLPPTNRKGGR